MKVMITINFYWVIAVFRPCTKTYTQCSHWNFRAILPVKKSHFRMTQLPGRPLNAGSHSMKQAPHLSHQGLLFTKNRCYRKTAGCHILQVTNLLKATLRLLDQTVFGETVSIPNNFIMRIQIKMPNPSDSFVSLVFLSFPEIWVIGLEQLDKNKIKIESKLIIWSNKSAHYPGTPSYSTLLIFLKIIPVGMFPIIVCLKQ